MKALMHVEEVENMSNNEGDVDGPVKEVAPVTMEARPGGDQWREKQTITTLMAPLFCQI